MKDVPDFLHHLPKDASTKIALAEPIIYGALIVAMDSADGPRPRDVLTPFLRADNLGAKLTAIGAYYAGEKSEAGGLTALEDDRTTLPTCDPGDKCGWTCDVPKIGSPDTETKTITTVGEFVRWCVEPSLK